MIEKPSEGRVDRGKVRIVVEVLGFDIEHDGVLGMVEHDCAVALVTLCHEILATRIPACVGSENGNFRADIMRGMDSGRAKGVGGHGRNCRFAVHSRHEDSFFPESERGKGLGAADHRFAQPLRGIIGRITLANRGGVDDQLSIDHVLRALRRAEI